MYVKGSLTTTGCRVVDLNRRLCRPEQSPLNYPVTHCILSLPFPTCAHIFPKFDFFLVFVQLYLWLFWFVLCISYITIRCYYTHCLLHIHVFHNSLWMLFSEIHSRQTGGGRERRDETTRTREEENRRTEA